VTDPAHLGVVEAAALLAQHELSSTELVAACLERIRERDGVHSHDGDPSSINAWVRVYEEDATAAAAAADERLSAAVVHRDGPAPPLCGVPVGLKDLYAVAGKPLTASSRLLHEVPERHCDVWARLEAAGMVLLGHLHTHEFAAGGTTDQVGNPWSLDRSAGGSSGGSAAALAARMVPAATGTETAGSLRIPSSLSGISSIKPTYGLVSMTGIVPLAPSLDHAGPMARSVDDCAAMLRAMAGPDRGRASTSLHAYPPEPVVKPQGSQPFAGLRLLVSPRVEAVSLDPDVAHGFDAALSVCRQLGATLVDVPPPETDLDLGDDFLNILTSELLAYHRRFDSRRERYRPSIREWVEEGERRAISAEAYVAAQTRRRHLTAAWADWLAAGQVDAVVEPTVPIVAPLRGDGYDHAGTDFQLISLTHYWDWTGFPAVALPSGVGSRSGLPVGVSLIGHAGADWELLSLGIALQAELGVPEPPS
jgi:aspartyl-tRNA(Asn)/glutamyl-tRNA(Gln) amidotransferase subunit A